MLSTMRKNLKSLSWTLWLVILAFIGFIFVEWGSGKLDSFSRESDLLTINGENIRADVFHKNLTQTIDLYRQQFKERFNPAILQQLRLPEQILQTIINTTILAQEADKHHIDVSDEELQARIKTIPWLQRDGRFVGAEAYQRLLAYRRIDISDFEKDLRKEVAIDKLKELITAGLVIDGHTLRDMYRQEKDTAELEYILLRSDRIKKEIKPSESEMKAYYEGNKDRFKSPEKREGTVVAFKFEDFKNKIKIDQQILYEYFKNNKKQFITPGKTKISRILFNYTPEDREAVLKQAQDLHAQLSEQNFAAKAKEISQDEKAGSGGDWGYYDWKQFTKQELSIIKNLTQTQISSPVDTLSSFSILFAAEKVKEKQQAFAEVTDRIRGILEKERLDALVQKKLAAAHGDLQNLEDIGAKAREMGLDVTETGALTAGEPILGLDEMGYISRTLFELKAGEIRYPVDFMNGKALVQLTAVIPPRHEPYDAVKARVEEQVIQAKKSEMMIPEAKNLKATLVGMGNAEKVDNFLKSKDLTRETLSYSRGNKLSHLPAKNGLDEIIFALEDNTYAEPIRYDNEVALVKLTSKHISDNDEFARNLNGYYQSKIVEKKNMYFADYLYDKRRRYKVRINEELFEKIRDYVISKYRGG